MIEKISQNNSRTPLSPRERGDGGEGLLVSVIIPTYNYAQYILQAIHSVLQQNYNRKLVEIIVVDDGSTDNTYEVLQPLVVEGLVKYYYQPNAGKAAATRKGIELAGGDIIFNLDADDWFLPGKLKKSVALFRTDVSLVHVASTALIHWEDGHRPDKIEPIPVKLLGTRLYGGETLHYFMRKNMLYGGGTTFAARAWALKQMRWSDAVDMYTDEWLLIEMLQKGDSYIFPEPLSVWRVHGKNYSGAAGEAALTAKHQRMAKSSRAILDLLENYNYPPWLVKGYRLKHEVRKMVWLEEADAKKLKDVILFIRKGIFSGNSIKTLRNYKAFNRLVKGLTPPPLRPGSGGASSANAGQVAQLPD